MATCASLKQNALGRIEAGKTLIVSGDFDLAIELFVFALECALKSCICKTLKLKEYPDQAVSKDVSNFFRTHDFDRLLLLSGFQTEFEFRIGNKRKFQNWSTATSSWDVSKRYAEPGLHTKQEAQRVLLSLMRKHTGVVAWIDEHNLW